jgi:rhodanese-related sulfurtransferase
MRIRTFMRLLPLASISLLVFTASAGAAEQKAKSANAESVSHPEVSRVTVEELKNMIDKGTDMVIVDTRDAGSYDFGHIKGAVNIYYNSAGDPTERSMMLMALPMDKLIVIYCDCSDEETSAALALELHKLGYERDLVKALKGGTIRWNELKYPLEPTKK